MERRSFIKKSGIASVAVVGLSINLPKETPKKITPNALKKGDTIALIAPAGAVFSPHYIEKLETKLTSWGFKVLKGKTLFAQEGYLAGSDELRAKEINTLFTNKTVKAIFCMRGGWGCNRLLDLLDFEVIKKNPKILMGYSDITSLLMVITHQTGLVTYHGPMGYSSWKSFSTKEVYKVLVNGLKVKMTNPEDETNQLKVLSPGKSTGELIGGNLTVICSLIGTKYEPNWDNKILFIEETGEEPYRIDRLFWQLKLADVFDKVNGIVLGSFRNCIPEEPEKSFSLQEVFDQHFNGLKKPVYMGASFGHTVNKFTLPIGTSATVNADNFTIQLEENPTRFNG